MSVPAIMDAIGRALDVPVVSIGKEERATIKGRWRCSQALDMPASAAAGWTSTGIGLIAEIGQPGYFKV